MNVEVRSVRPGEPSYRVAWPIGPFDARHVAVEDLVVAHVVVLEVRVLELLSVNSRHSCRHDLRRVRCGEPREARSRGAYAGISNKRPSTNNRCRDREKLRSLELQRLLVVTRRSSPPQTVAASRGLSTPRPFGGDSEIRKGLCTLPLRQSALSLSRDCPFLRLLLPP